MELALGRIVDRGVDDVVAADLGRKIGALETGDFGVVTGEQPALDAQLIGLLQVEQPQRVADPALGGPE